MTSSALVDCGDWRLHCSHQGQGPDLILLHGGLPGTSGARAFGANVDALSAHFSTYVLDFPGWGQSSKNLFPPGSYGNPLAQAGRVVLAFMQALGLSQAHLMGNSFGASAALQAALQGPEKVSSLVLIAPGGGALPASMQPHAPLAELLDYYLGSGPSWDRFCRLMRSMHHAPDLLTEEWLRSCYAASLDSETLRNPPLRRPPAPPSPAAMALWQEPGLATLRAPCLFIWGENAAMQPLPCLASFGAIPRQEQLLLPACGHWPHREHPDTVHAQSIAFMHRHPPKDFP